MKLLRVGHSVYVPTEQIKLLEPFPSRPARREKARAEAAGLFHDGTVTGGKSRRKERTRSLVITRDGSVIASPFHVEALVNRAPIEVPVRRSTRRNDIPEASDETAGIQPEHIIGAAPAPDESAAAANEPKTSADDSHAVSPQEQWENESETPPQKPRRHFWERP